MLGRLTKKLASLKLVSVVDIDIHSSLPTLAEPTSIQ
jgi:hypothetical protein